MNRGGIIKKIVNVEIGKNYIKITLLRKSKSEIYIYKSLITKFQLQDNEKCNIDKYTKLVTQMVGDELRGLEKSYNNIVYNIQNDQTIIRNIEILNVKNKKDILKMIELEITQYTPINLNDYILKYKEIKSNKDKLNLQVILIHKSIIRLCREITKNLKCRKSALYINCDILQKILSLELIEKISEKGIFIECNYDEFIINIVKNNKVYESHILPRTIQSCKSIGSLFKDFKDVYYYGEYDKFIETYLGDTFNIKTLRFSGSIKLIKNVGLANNSNMSHLNSVGIII